VPLVRNSLSLSQPRCLPCVCLCFYLTAAVSCWCIWRRQEQLCLVYSLTIRCSRLALDVLVVLAVQLNKVLTI
jgi:hypothetical protein